MGLVRADSRMRETGAEDATQARRREAQALGQTPGAAAELGRRLQSETDPAMREVLFRALVAQGDLAAARVLADHLRAADAGLRNSALAALTAMPGPAAEVLGELLHDPDPALRIFGVLLAGDLPLSGIELTLFARLQDETDANVCATLLEVLQGLGQALPGPLRASTAQRFRTDPFVQFLLAQAPTLGGAFAAAQP